MAYVKPQMLCQDMPLTFQAVNILQNDLDTHWLIFSLRHGVEDRLDPRLVPAPPVHRRYGQHNDVRIPRAVLALTGAALSTGQHAVWGAAGNEPNLYEQPTRIDVGVVELEVYLGEFYAEAWPMASGGVGGPARFVNPISIFPNQGTIGVLRLELYELQSTAMTPADFDFWVSIYGSP